MKGLSRRWAWFLALAFAAGIALRMVWAQDMEWKEDEQFNFFQSQLAFGSHPWPWLGMPSGVYIPNPGMSVWVFAWLARLFGAHDPVSLAHALQLFSLAGIALIVPFALRFVKTAEEREPWLWATALALVNPFAILYERKLWPEPFLPFFTMLMLMGFWRREAFLGALAWGLIGAFLGQIHMSGFFLAGGFVAWTLLFDRRSACWRGWFLGSALGALPLLPWIAEVLRHPTREHILFGWDEISQLKFWVFWVSDALGLHLGNPLGLLRGNSTWAQVSDFVRYPLVGRRPTYVVGAAHLLVLGAGSFAIVSGIFGILTDRARIVARFIGRGSRTAFTQSAALWGNGILLTLTGVTIRRYYMMVNFPLEFVWLARMALADARRARKILALIWIGELVISAGFVWYVHVNGGSVQGDYGVAYHLSKERR